MRVITGTARGRRLRTLEGVETRPTTDMVKESMFNIIQFDVEGRRVLDLFAGSGQLGIEAMSRGAVSAAFVDSNPEAVRIIRENLENTGFLEKSKVVSGEAVSFLSSVREKFDLILMDPPYRTGLLRRALEQIAAFDILSPGGIIICESESDFVLPEPLDGFQAHEYRYGRTKVSLLTKK